VARASAPTGVPSRLGDRRAHRMTHSAGTSSMVTGVDEFGAAAAAPATCATPPVATAATRLVGMGSAVDIGRSVGAAATPAAFVPAPSPRGLAFELAFELALAGSSTTERRYAASHASRRSLGYVWWDG